MTSFLITGVAGFIGSNLAERLVADGHRVIGIDNLAYGVIEQVPDRVEFHERDIRDASIYRLYQGVDVVFHLAAKNCIEDWQRDPVYTFDINVRGTTHVFEAARRAGARKVIYAESAALYEGVTSLPSSERETRPLSFYALSKEAGRLVAQGYERFANVVSTGLRYFCVYGPRQDYRRTIPPVMSAFIIKLLRGERPVIYGSGAKRRDFIYVDDVNDLHVLCAFDRRTDGMTYNVGSGVSYSVREIYERIAGLLGKRLEPIYQGDLPGEAEHTLADIGRARSLGWEPKVDLTAGLEEPTILGTAGGVRKVLSELGQTFLVVYGDNLVELDLSAFVESHLRRRADVSIALFDDSTPNTGMAGGRVALGADETVASFTEGAAGVKLAGFVNAGVYAVENRVLSGFPEARFLDWGKDVFPALLGKGARIFGYPIQGY